VLVYPDRGNVRVQCPAIRQFGPVVDDLITKAIRPEYDRHGHPSLDCLEVDYRSVTMQREQMRAYPELRL
jgi:hypothetical protein